MVNSEKGENGNGNGTKRQRGPWLVRRATKKGKNVISLRFPSETEREKNRMRERMRRKITSRIYAGLRASGGYGLPKNADNNLLLIALCEEAGWKVEEDGTIFRKDSNGSGDAKDNGNQIGDNNVDLRLSL